jgi:transcriptional regulator GlxA family with amidase domain
MDHATAPPHTHPAPLICFYVFPGHTLIDLAGPLSAFKVPDEIGRPGLYEVAVVSQSGGIIPSCEGVDVMSLSRTGRPVDTLVVAGGPGVFHLKETETAAVRAHAQSARRVTSVCTGAFLLARTGLLDGRRATTHWADAEQLARSFPSVHVESDRIFVQDGSVWSSAGATAGIDLALALIEDDHGPDLARAVARHLVVPFRRRGGQSQYSEMLSLDPLSDRIARTLQFAQVHLAENLTVERLASIACLSPRQFGRAFHDATGETPATAIERLRAEAAKARVETSREPIEAIATSVGFGDPERMRRAFIRRFGSSPQAMRRTARGGGTTTQEASTARADISDAPSTSSRH